MMPSFPRHFRSDNTPLILDLDAILVCCGVIILIMALMSTRFRPRGNADASLRSKIPCRFLQGIFNRSISRLKVAKRHRIKKWAFPTPKWGPSPIDRPLPPW
jgi:hypothetical protein